MRFYRVSNGLQWVTMGYNGLNWVPLGLMRFYRVLLGFIWRVVKVFLRRPSITSDRATRECDLTKILTAVSRVFFISYFFFGPPFRSSHSGGSLGYFSTLVFFYFKFSFLFILFFLEKRAIHWPRDKWIRSSLLLLLLLMLLMLAMTLPFKSFSLFLRHEIIGFGTQQPSNSVKPGKTR